MWEISQQCAHTARVSTVSHCQLDMSFMEIGFVAHILTAEELRGQQVQFRI